LIINLIKRNERQTPESRASIAINDRHRLRDLLEQLNTLNIRLQPFYTLYCQYINDDPHFESAEVWILILMVLYLHLIL